jgi:1,4-alpha-glucan branching enzyme
MKPKILLILLLAPASLAAATHDNDVEWFGVFSYPGYRSPLFPATGESFTVELRVYRGDITGARVRAWDGSEHFYSMSRNRTEGPYDIYRSASIPANRTYVYYYFEITDGTKTDYYNALGMWSDPPPRGDFLVDAASSGRYPLGATVVPGGVVFRVWAPNATSAAVAGSFNGFSTIQSPMTSNQGFWEALVPNAGAGQEYKFVFNGGNVRRTDPYARRQINSAGNSVIVHPGAYVWGDAGWVTPFFEDMVIYELHVGSFSGQGDGVGHYPGHYRDVVDKHLDHLAGLGINMVELLPVGEFAGDQSWGYNPSFQFAPESAYGAPDDLKYLVDRCHRRGIGVIMDVVYNHMGGSDLSGNLLDFDGTEIYFYPNGNAFRDTPWGPRLDYGRVEVRNYIRENVRYWLEELHMDGLRIDATSFINVNGDGWQVLKDIAQTADTVSPKVIVVAEQLPNDVAVTRPIDQGGAGLDTQWDDLFHDNLRQAIQDAAFGDPSMRAIAAGVNHFDFPSGTNVVNYIESHDEAGHQGRVAEIADPGNHQSIYAHGRSKVAAALVLFAAGIPMLLQGQEFLEDRRFGDARENRIQWSYATSHGDFLKFTQDAVRLRRAQPALRSSSLQNVFHVNDTDNVLAFHRWTGWGDDLVIVVSLNNNDLASYELGFPLPGDWFEVFNGDAGVYGGQNHGNAGKIAANGSARDGLAQSASISIPRMGVLVFARKPLTPGPEPGFVRGNCNGDRTVDISDAIRTLGILFLGLSVGECHAACDANADGRVDISDGIYTLTFLFGSGPAPSGPYPGCGPNPGSLECTAVCRQ